MLFCTTSQLGIITTMILIFFETGHSLWWSLGQKEPLLIHSRICRRARKLKGPQKFLCSNNPEIMNEVIRGSTAALHQCQHQFKDHRWNCTLHRKWLRKILRHDSKESAALNAFIAAGVTHSVTEGCSSGKLPQCSCKHEHEDNAITSTGHPSNKLSNRRHPMNRRSKKDKIKAKQVQKLQSKALVINQPNQQQLDDETRGIHLSGCGDDVDFGYRVSRKIMDFRYTKGKRQRDARTLVMLHNNDAGRKLVQQNMQIVCKCHGLSGSCSFKTCSKKLPSMAKVGQLVYDKYLSAIKVVPTNDGKGITSAVPWQTLSKESLVYLEDSTNFCRRNLEEGSPGTRGRECDAKGVGFGSCDLLCCGRGHRTLIIQDVENCRCKFEFCCKVICDKCEITREKAYCK